jgi:TPR repeat protein
MGSRVATVLLVTMSVLVVEAQAGMGLWTRDLSRSERARVAEGEPLGVMVGAVYPGSPAASAGILSGDRIIAVGGHTISSDAAFSRALRQLETRAPVRLEIRRGGRALTIEVQPVDALKYLGVACEAGEGLACHDLAVAYRSGNGVPRDPTKAAELLRRGCKLGAAHACTMLAWRLARGRDGPANPADAIPLMKEACEHGDGEACRMMAEYHGGGHFGLERSRPWRRAYLEMGCSAGNRISCNELGKALEDGDGGPEEPAQAAVAYESGCARDLAESCVWLGWLLVKGKGLPADAGRGRKLFERSCASGFFRGCISQAQLLLRQRDGTTALEILSQTCAEGHEEACCLTAQVHEKGLGGVRPDVPRAARIYEKLCREGHGHACSNLAFLYNAGRPYMAGKGLQKDEARSGDFYEKACALDDMEGCWRAGLLYTQGERVASRDLERGRTLLKRACDAGLAAPCESLRTLDERAEERRLAPEWRARRARGEMAPGQMHYSGQIRVQGQTNRIALTTTIRDQGGGWIVEEQWTFGGSSMTEISVLDKGTLFLRRHTTQAGGTIREFEIRDGWVVGWTGSPELLEPDDEIFIEAPDPILGWGAGAPQVIATLPLASGFETSLRAIQLSTQSVVARNLEVLAVGTIRVPAGTFSAWKVAIRDPGPGGHFLTIWIDTRSRQVLRYDGRTHGPGPWWTLTLEP